MPADAPNPIILYDGVCGFCNRTVQFILKRDSKDRFRFATLQSEFAGNLLRKHGLSAQSLDSVYLVLDVGQPTERLQVSSNASISIGRELGIFWRTMANLLSIVPQFFRDWGYSIIARYRYHIFGKYDVCPLPKASDRHKFLDVA
jgi:predicted DCC family thiol-disulfide oxidoreductase YuxK